MLIRWHSIFPSFWLPLLPNKNTSYLQSSLSTEELVGFSDRDDFEFLELKNTSALSIDMNGVYFGDGIIYAFPESSVLAPGAVFVLTRSAD